MEQTGVYRKFPVRLIRPPRDPARQSMDADRLAELADSIAAEGLHQPVGLVLDVDGEHADLAWGHRRLCAVQSLAWEYVDAKVFPSGTDLNLARWSENGQRQDLNPLEEAHEVRRFLERGASRAFVARMFRRSESWLKERLALLDLPEDLQECISNRSLALGVVSVLAGVDHRTYRESLIREAVANGASVAVAQVWLAHYLADRTRIVSNTVTVEELARERQAFRLVVACEWCEESHPVEDTRTVRLCSRCAAELDAAKRRAMQETG